MSNNVHTQGRIQDFPKGGGGGGGGFETRDTKRGGGGGGGGGGGAEGRAVPYMKRGGCNPQHPPPDPPDRF